MASDASASQVEIRSLEICARILDLLSTTPGRISAAEIARNLDMTPPRVWRYLNTLAALGYVDNTAPGRGFTLGGKLARLGHTAMDRLDIADVAREPLIALRDELKEAVYLAVPHDDQGAVIVSLDSGGTVSLRLSLGTRFHGHDSASGRVLMAFASETRQTRFLASNRPAGGHDPIDDPEALRSRYALIKDRFYDTAETADVARTSGTMFMNAIAGPIFDHTNQIAGAIGVLTGVAGEDAVAAPRIRLPLFATLAAVSAALGSDRWASIETA